MIRDIRKKLVILTNRAPFKEETKKYIDHLERVDWLVMNMRLDGSTLNRSDIEAVLEGEQVLKGRIMDHMLLAELEDMRLQIYGEKKLEFVSKEWRKNTPVIDEYGYMPPLPVEIPKLFNELGDFISKREAIEDPFVKAAEIHNRFIAMYPFKEHNQIAARGLMEYYLVGEGYPMVFLDVAEEEYNGWIESYLKGGSSKALAEYMTKATLDRLELFIQLTDF